MWEKPAMKYTVVLLPVFYAAASLAASPVQYDVSVGISRDDNITRAELDRDIIEDNIIRAGAGAGYKLALNDISYASFRASLDINQYQDFDKLSSTDLGAQASYHIRPSSGYTATSYFALVGYEQNMVDSDQRDGSTINLRIGLSKRLTDIVTFRAGIGKETVNAGDSVFDEDNTQIYIDFDFRLGDNNTLYTTLSAISGDIVATAQATPKLIGATTDEQRVRDDAFRDLSPNRVAYKLDADTNTLRLGDIYKIDSMQAIDVSALYYSSSAYWDNDYSGMIIDLTYVYRF